MTIKIISLIIGGSIGTIARYFLGAMVYKYVSSGFPYGTLAVNISGCFILGILSALSENKFVMSPETRVLLMIGFCGAFTTFSTIIFETDKMISDGETIMAVINILGSVVAGFIMYRAGAWLGRIV